MRMLIGTSLGGCLQSIMKGEVSEDEVLLLITRTMCTSQEGLMAIVEMYHSNGNFLASRPDQYKMSEFPLDEVKTLAIKLVKFISLATLMNIVGSFTPDSHKVMDAGLKLIRLVLIQIQ